MKAVRLPPEFTPQAFDLHEELIAWLVEHYPFVNSLVVLTALAYEQARIVHSIAPDLPERDLDEMLAGVMDTMRAQLRAYRRGDLPKEH